MWFTQHDRVVYSTTNLRANRMLVGLIIRKPVQQFQFVHFPTKEERDKNMGLLAQFSTTFTSHLICTQQPYCTRTTFPIELYQAVGQASFGAI